MPLLFSYGTLQDEDVQLSTFGRRLEGRADELPGYVRSQVTIGTSAYANVTASGRDGSRVRGTVFEISDAELAAADLYERDASYERMRATLASGTPAWVYFHR